MKLTASGCCNRFSRISNDIKSVSDSIEHLLNETEKNPSRFEEAKSLSNKLDSFIINDQQQHIVSELV